jgi:hypothetical protein
MGRRRPDSDAACTRRIRRAPSVPTLPGSKFHQNKGEIGKIAALATGISPKANTGKLDCASPA